MSVRILALRYLVFAVVATGINFAFQSVSLAVYAGRYGLMISIVCGTGAGFLVKYVLDKYFIFFDRTTAAAQEARKLMLYGVTAVGTTLVFWSFELAFWTMFGMAIAKYTGAAIGLGIGYIFKYRLDRRFVFSEACAT